jgi:hypothetical protein
MRLPFHVMHLSSMLSAFYPKLRISANIALEDYPKGVKQDQKPRHADGHTAATAQTISTKGIQPKSPVSRREARQHTGIPHDKDLGGYPSDPPLHDWGVPSVMNVKTCSDSSRASRCRPAQPLRSVLMSTAFPPSISILTLQPVAKQPSAGLMPAGRARHHPRKLWPPPSSSNNTFLPQDSVIKSLLIKALGPLLSQMECPLTVLELHHRICVEADQVTLLAHAASSSAHASTSSVTGSAPVVIPPPWAVVQSGDNNGHAAGRSPSVPESLTSLQPLESARQGDSASRNDDDPGDTVAGEVIDLAR